MKAYWRKETNEIKGYDEHKNPLYYTEEKSGEIVGAFYAGGGQMFVVALPNGMFDTIEINRCYQSGRCKPFM